jgi:DNA replication protein DnaC
MYDSLVERLTSLKLEGMQKAFRHLAQNGELTQLEPLALLTHLLQAEWEEKENRRLSRLLQAAQFRYGASVEEVAFPAGRSLDKTLFLALSDTAFVKRKENLLITGPTGIGKSFLASALGHQACLAGWRVQYYNLSKLFTRLAMAKVEGSYVREMNRLARIDLLILDDFGLQLVAGQMRMELLELIEDRHGRKSTLVCSQLPISEWHQMIEDSTIADAILDRLVHSSHRLELKGESMRKKK